MQRYVERPLCLDGYQFDLRLSMVGTSFQPVRAAHHTYMHTYMHTYIHTYIQRHCDDSCQVVMECCLSLCVLPVAVAQLQAVIYWDGLGSPACSVVSCPRPPTRWTLKPCRPSSFTEPTDPFRSRTRTPAGPAGGDNPLMNHFLR